MRYPSVVFGTLVTPLIAVVATALARRRLAGILAALFAACHPLLIYYSQEARMYAMLIALGAFLGYIVVRRAWSRSPGRLSWVAYVLVATAAVYTHYFAFFLIFALAIAFLIDQALRRFRLRQPRLNGFRAGGPEIGEVEIGAANVGGTPNPGRSPLPLFLLANLLVLLLYLPWFAVLFTRLSVDTSYWQGQLKIGEALRHIAISFITGETVLESQAIQLLWPYALLTGVALTALLLKRPTQYRTLHYAVLWLILPIIGVLLLALVVPKFNARYAMIALPGLILAWSAGLAALLTIKPRRSRLGVYRPNLNLSFLVAGLCTLFILIGFIIADRNWYQDPAFTKAQWRELSEFLRAEIGERGEQEAVVLVSG
ncbi:MAG: hypothetical protein HC802_20195, partial [Caldilineaceae bacterium]|nr:hypothetical protein [Caldilineaceae bacterium]